MCRPLFREGLCVRLRGCGVEGGVGMGLDFPLTFELMGSDPPCPLTMDACEIDLDVTR